MSYLQKMPDQFLALISTTEYTLLFMRLMFHQVILHRIAKVVSRILHQLSVIGMHKLCNQLLMEQKMHIHANMLVCVKFSIKENLPIAKVISMSRFANQC